MSMKYETIVYQVDDHARDGDAEPPDVHNAMNDVMRRELTRCFGGLGDDDDVKVVVSPARRAGVLGGRGHPRVRRAARAVKFREHRRRVDFRPAMDAARSRPRRRQRLRFGRRSRAGARRATSASPPPAAQMGLTRDQPRHHPPRRRHAAAAGDWWDADKALEMILTGRAHPGRRALRIGLVERVGAGRRGAEGGIELARAIAQRRQVALPLRQGGGGEGPRAAAGRRPALEGDCPRCCGTTEDRRRKAQGIPGERAPALAGDIALAFGYYARLSRAQQAIYRKSDAITEIRAAAGRAVAGAVDAVESALLAEDRAPPRPPASG